MFEKTKEAINDFKKTFGACALNDICKNLYKEIEEAERFLEYRAALYAQGERTIEINEQLKKEIKSLTLQNNLLRDSAFCDQGIKISDLQSQIEVLKSDLEVSANLRRMTMKDNLDYKMFFGEFNESSLLERLWKLKNENESLKKQLEEKGNYELINIIREKLAKILNETPLDIKVATFFSNMLYQMEHKE
jgi:hypothetical protein